MWLGHFGAATAGGDPYAAAAALDEGARTLEAWVAAVRSLRAGAGDGRPAPALAAWLHARERAEGWPADASAQLDATSDPAVDAAGVAGWLDRA